MGILRLLLACSVVVVHVYGDRDRFLVGGATAVQIFYMISGFYMGLILTEKYLGPCRYRLFIRNRALRVFPTYLVVLIASVAMWMVIGLRTGSYGPLDIVRSHLKLSVLALLIGVQIVLFGQEIFLFVHRSESGWIAPGPVSSGHYPGLVQYMIVPPAWSLSLEWWFYLLAPFLVKLSSRMLLVIGGLSLLVRIFLDYGLDLRSDPWSYRFFPSELLLFVGGVLAYRRYRAVRSKRPSTVALTTIAMLIFGLFFAFPYLRGNRVVAGLLIKQWLLYATVWASLPFLFLWSNPSETRYPRLQFLDFYLGELSYPIYITHFLVIELVTLNWHRIWSPAVTSLVVLCVVFVIAAFIVRFIVQPIECIRRQRGGTGQIRVVHDASNVVTA